MYLLKDKTTEMYFKKKIAQGYYHYTSDIKEATKLNKEEIEELNLKNAVVIEVKK